VTFVVNFLKQVALLLQRGRAMIHVRQKLASIGLVQNIEHSYILLVTQATDLSLCANKCAVLLSWA